MELIKKVSQKRFFFVSTFSFFFLLIIVSCSEEPLRIGINLLPEDELLQVHDTVLTVELYTVSAEPLLSRSLTSNSLGSINDPVMGTLKSDYLTVFKHNGAVSFDDSIKDGTSIYNLELQLYFISLYGDTNEIDFDVFELIEHIPVDGESDYVVPPAHIGPNSLNLGAPERMSGAQGDTSIFHVMLDYNDNEFAKKFIEPEIVKEGLYKNDSAGHLLFMDYFKGLYIATEFRNTEGGAIMQVNNSLSKLILRTLEWNSDSNWHDTVSTVFSVGNPAVIWNQDTAEVKNLGMYQNTFSADVADVLDDTINSKSLAYIQSLTGPNVMIEMPTLQDFLGGFEDNLVIHKAEMKLPVNMELYDSVQYESPDNLGLVNSVSKTFLHDDLPIPYYFGGGLDEGSYVYMFNIGNDLNEFINDESDSLKKYLLFPANKTTPVTLNEILPGRVVLNGGNTISDPPTLKIIYSLISK
jgi:hypothetical protein